MKMWISVVLLLLVPRSAGSPASVFRTTGASVTLEFQQHRQLKRESVGSVVWKFGQDKIMKYLPHKETIKILGHEGRLEFHKETFSLELKNLQKIDGGIYRGEITAEEIDFEAEYRLSVLDPVEAPVLSIVSKQSCDNLSNVTVTCRGRDLSLTSTCKNITCFPEGVATDDSTLTLSVKDDIITCNHSNLVSSKDTSMGIATLCPYYLDMESTINYCWCLIPVLLGLCACCTAVFLWKKRQTGSKESVENPIYGEQRLEALSNSETIYSVVKKHNNHMI
ncbi:uncharacterized protein LOC134098059 [Sardina pilchardus]|uniref:uncharacterized protein LOC134098059 n=1 Tax=Sardina pilchardus TaxID=27697 RepID=UPI002E0FF51F